MSRTFVLLLAATLAAACAPRTTAATQPGSKPFDATQSDARAVEIADQVLAALGGAEAWDKNAREIQWDQVVFADGRPVYVVTHSWDRWNGRHRFERIDPGSGSIGITMQDLYDGTGFAKVRGEGGSVDATSDEKRKMMAEAQDRWQQDSYLFLLPYKLKDPGVHLRHAGEEAERPAAGSPEAAAAPADATAPATQPAPKWDVLKVTFDGGVGPSSGDTYYVYVNKETKLIDRHEVVPAGKPDTHRLGYAWEDWTTVAGLKVATRRTNLGFPNSQQVPVAVSPQLQGIVPAGLQVPSPGELVLFHDIKMNAEPDDTLYVPDVREHRGGPAG